MIKVFHVQVGEEHYYFGSKKAIFHFLGKDVLGIGYGAFRNVKNLKEVPYRNKRCIIREGVLLHAPSYLSKDKDDRELDLDKD